MSKPELTSRVYAEKLRKIADFLDSRPVFELEYDQSKTISFWSKDKFVNAVKAIGNATKTYDEGEHSSLYITPVEFPDLKLSIMRSSVCKKIVKFECEPLFSDSELESL